MNIAIGGMAAALLAVVGAFGLAAYADKGSNNPHDDGRGLWDKPKP
jgi:hypothetical protein